MIEIITSTNRHLYKYELSRMFEMRYDVAVNELGWSIPDIEKNYDLDEFDHDETVYFLSFDKDRNIIGTARLNPTTRPHLMSEVFPGLCRFKGVPVSPEIYEYSRFLVRKRGVDRAENIRVQAHISLAIVEYCLAAKISQISWLTYRRSYPLALRMWKTRPLGFPQYFEEDDAHYIAAISDMTPESLRRTRDLAHIQHPVSNILLPIEYAPSLALLNKPQKLNFG